MSQTVNQSCARLRLLELDRFSAEEPRLRERYKSERYNDALSDWTLSKAFEGQFGLKWQYANAYRQKLLSVINGETDLSDEEIHQAIWHEAVSCDPLATVMIGWGPS